MRKLIAFALLALALVGAVVSLSSAHADTITDNFNAPTLNSQWALFGSTNYSVSTGASGLTVSYSSSSPNPAGTDGGVVSNFSFDGNFTLTVVQNISGMPVINPPSSFVNGGPVVFAANGSSFIGPYNELTGPTTEGSVFENGVYIGGQNFSLSSETNILRYQRVGDTVFELIAPAGSSSFTQLYSASGAIFLGPTSLNLGLAVQGTEPVTNASVTYSNFSVVYGADPSLPSVVSGVTGGTASDPAALPGQSVDEITGAIGPAAPQDFFRFHWNGGAFNSVANLVGADPSSTYAFELLGGPGGSAILDSADYFQGTIFYSDLASGDYAIGISTTSAQDPHITSISQPRSPARSRSRRPGR